MENHHKWGKIGGGRGGEVVGGRRLQQGCRYVFVMVRQKNYEKLQGNKQGQRRDVRAQLRDVPERGAANVAMLGSNVATFQSGLKPTSRRSYPTSRRSREGIIQCRDIVERLFSKVATLGSNIATFQIAMLRANVATLQRRPKMQNFQQCSKVKESPHSAIGDSL